VNATLCHDREKFRRKSNDEDAGGDQIDELHDVDFAPIIDERLADIERKLRDGERDRARRLRVRSPLRVTFEY